MNEESARLQKHLSTLMNLRRWEEVLPLSYEILAIDPESSYAHRCAATSHWQLDQHSQAQEQVQKLLALKPESSSNQELAGKIFSNSKRYKLAHQHFEEAIRLDPHNCNALTSRGWLYLSQRKFHQALHFAEQARTLDPRDPDILNLYTSSLDLLGKSTPGETVANLREALTLDPENAHLHDNLGLVYLYDLKDYPNALTHFRTSLALEPEDKETKKYLLSALRKKNIFLRITYGPANYLKDWLVATRINLYPIIFVVLLAKGTFILIFLCIALSIFFLPTALVFENFFISDIRRAKGKPSHFHRLGPFDPYKWPLPLRLFAFVVIFCCSLFFLITLIDLSKIVIPMLCVCLGVLLLYYLVLIGAFLLGVYETFKPYSKS